MHFIRAWRSLASLLKAGLWRFKYHDIKVKSNEEYTQAEKEELWKFYHKEILGPHSLDDKNATIRHGVERMSASRSRVPCAVRCYVHTSRDIGHPIYVFVSCYRYGRCYSFTQVQQAALLGSISSL